MIPAGVVSLHSLMLRYAFDDFCLAYRILCRVYHDQTVGDILGTPEEGLQYCQNMGLLVTSICKHITTLEMDASLIEQTKKFAEDLQSESSDRRIPVLKVRLGAIIDGIQNNLGSRFIYLVPQKRGAILTDYYWAEATSETFPLAVVDMLDMNLCYAFGRYTATVFHAMRAAEHGLRFIARKVNVSLKDKRKPCPIEYGTWDKVINGINRKIDSLRQKPKGSKKEAELKFFAEAASHCSYMKDIWRNEVSHVRRRYNEQEALAAMRRITEFLLRLAAGAESEEKNTLATVQVQKTLANSATQQSGTI